MISTPFLVAILLIIANMIQIFALNRRILLLETKLLQTNQEEYLNYLQPKLPMEKVAATKALRQAFPELGLTQAAKIYDLATTNPPSL